MLLVAKVVAMYLEGGLLSAQSHLVLQVQKPTPVSTWGTQLYRQVDTRPVTRTPAAQLPSTLVHARSLYWGTHNTTNQLTRDGCSPTALPCFHSALYEPPLGKNSVPWP